MSGKTGGGRDTGMSHMAQLFMERFFSRRDVYGRYWQSTRADGSKASGYAPVCKQLWSDGCGLKTGACRCHNCPIKEYEPVSEASVLRHIHGEERQIQYLLMPDGTVRYAALDWDMKEGKEAQGYTFAEVQQAVEVLRGWGIPCAVARSTGKGHHLYIFLSEPYPANRIRAILYEVLERAGPMDFMRRGVKPLTEIFPKQSLSASDGSIGNGIRLPLVSSGIAQGRNCFVDDTGEMIGAGLSPDDALNAQWAYFESVPAATPAVIDAVIAGENIPVYEDGPAGRAIDSNLHGYLSSTRKRGQWQPAMNGSIEKVLEGCAALRRVRDKAASGEVLSHAEGFAVFHIAKETSDGLAWFQKNVPGWGQNEQDVRQLEHSLEKNYSPWTCRRIQEAGICKPGTVCFKKRPPVTTVEGQLVSRTDIPEKDWPEPSPIRYAFGPGDDFLKKLLTEANGLMELPPERRAEKLKDLAYRAQVFDAEQQKELKDHIKHLRDKEGKKLIKAGEIVKTFHAAADQSNEDLKNTLADGDSRVTVDDLIFQKLSPYGYGLVKPIRSKSKTTPLCNVDLIIEEVRSFVDSDTTTKKCYVGTARAPGIETEFLIDTETWNDNKAFMDYFGKLLDSRFNVLRQNVDLIRQACMAFSAKGEIDRTQFLITQGWYKDSYLMPGVVVDREGVKPNTEQRVDLSGKEHARNLDFKYLTDDEFKETLLHIKKDLLDCWPRKWSTIGLAHTFLPVLVKHLHIKSKPTLFYEGLTGAGKTALTHVLQHFWGEFDMLLNLTSTGRGLLESAHEFNDALLVIDDFKGIDHRQIEDVKKLLQYAYDGFGRVKCARDGSVMKIKGSRAVIMASGEHFISAESSVVARTILVEVEKHSTEKTGELHRRCEAMKKNYSGVTGRFIHWYLNNDRKAFREHFHATKDEFMRPLLGRQNAARIALNLSLNHLAWQLFVDFMLHSEVIAHDERAALIAEQLGYLKGVAMSMAARCEEEQSGVIFLRVLVELLETGEVGIRNLAGYTPDRKPVIGYVTKTDAKPTEVYFYPEATWKAVLDYSRSIAVNGTARSIARQLIELGVIIGCQEGRMTTQVRDGGAQRRVWIVPLEKLGLSKPVLMVVGGSEQLAFAPAGKPKKDDEGIF